MKFRTQTNKIVLHCSATKEGWDVRPERIREWHLHRGWHDVGYHYIIDLQGEIHIGRDIHKYGAHCKGQNHDSIGICYVGGLDSEGDPKDTLTYKQSAAFYKLVVKLRDIFGEMPIFGHNEFSEKACPSFDVEDKFGGFCRR